MKVAMLALALTATLAACGKPQAPVETARPVLVVHPSGGAQSAFSAYAGEIRAREESALSFRIGGSLVKRLVDAGDRVRRGQLLAELDPGDAGLQVAAAQAEMARLGGDLERYRKLVAQKLVSQSTFDAQQAAYRAARAQYELMRNQSAYTRLHAPRDGVIANRLAEAGQTVAAGQTVYTLAGDAGREVAIALPESRVRDVQVGQPVLVELWSAPGERLPGRVREISPAADPQARTYAARVALDGDAASAVELGQSARVYMQEHGEAAALSVPLSAVQRAADGKPASLWVVDPTSRRVHLAPVQLGAYAEEAVPVLGGVGANAWIVAAGGHLLREGQLVAPVDRDNRPVFDKTAPATAAK
ncbi:efflux RND transporter periplasmic adaptor subunit [Thermomonas sp. HDW16]|uniref:efflux RND transporter periplasmic adaptor subunit n=1 Tax=Thermomonas sp. HDW16 TaxID=2714945 RepID=UPI0014090CA3|nr:efflux RND transporter periplasmic adaptor subunit [Thermomonas sp. HDW16]QIL19837.1 efflux RND transporter periplasmic adaptor subunit [Thermomonas sp. HDW16]